MGDKGGSPLVNLTSNSDRSTLDLSAVRGGWSGLLPDGWRASASNQGGERTCSARGAA